MSSDFIRFGIIGDGGEFSALSVVQSLGRYGIPCFTFFRKKGGVCTFSKYHKGQYFFDTNISKMVDMLPSILLSKNITHIICLDEEIKFEIIRHIDEFKMFKSAFPTFESYAKMLRKHTSSKFVENLGIPVPNTKRPNSIDDLKNININGKLVIKGDRGNSSVNVRYADNRRDLVEFYKEISGVEADNDYVASPPIIQEYIGGPTYLSQAIVDKGKVKIVIPHRKIREWPLTGGVTSRAVTIDSPKLTHYMSTILEALNWHGEAGMEWKYNSEIDEFYFIEMNPRFEGSLEIANRAGVNFPLLLYLLMENRKVKSDIQYKSNVHYRLFFLNDFKNFLNNENYNFSTFLKETLNPNINGDITLDDIGIIKGLWKKPIREIKRFIKT